jgi:hypothetical protein
MNRIANDGELTIREGRDTAVDYPACMDGEQCLDDANRHNRLYRCTREIGHSDIHVAHGPDGTALARWDDE